MGGAGGREGGKNFGGRSSVRPSGVARAEWKPRDGARWTRREREETGREKRVVSQTRERGANTSAREGYNGVEENEGGETDRQMDKEGE